MRAKSLFVTVAVLAAGLIFVTGGEAAPTTTVTLKVTTTADSSTPCKLVNHKSVGACTLRGAILAANAYPEDNTRFAVNLAKGTYHLSLGMLDVEAPGVVRIVGATKGTAQKPASIINGFGNPKPASVFVIQTPAQLLNVVISGGSGDPDITCAGSYSGCGGGIVVESALDLENSVVLNNRACSAWTGNTCTGPYSSGGGIYMPYGPAYESLTLFKTTVTRNVAGGGGGIANDDTAHSLILATQSHIDGNTACFSFTHGVCTDYGFGGGLANQGVQVTLDNSTVNANVAGSPAYQNGDGGGIYENSGNMQLNHTLVSRNVAGYRGGGLYDYGTIDFVDSTVSSNLASTEGGGVYLYGLASFDHTTVSSNTAGGTFACTIGATASCAHAAATTTRDCATLYPSATTCTASPGLGGGVMGDGTTSPEFVSSTVSRNVAASIAGTAPGCLGGLGGGVYSGWTLTAVAGTRFANNHADCGGGIYNLFGQSYPFALVNSTISGNTALEDGGGIWTMGVGTGTLYGMKIVGNHAGHQTGGVWDDGVKSVLFGAGNSIKANTSPGTCMNVTWPCS